MPKITKNKVLPPVYGKGKAAAPAVYKNRAAAPVLNRARMATPIASRQQKAFSVKKASHLHLQRMYQDNGFIGLPDQRRIDFPASNYRNNPVLVAALVILALAFAAALAYICVTTLGPWQKTDGEEAMAEQSVAETADESIVEEVATQEQQPAETAPAPAPAPVDPANPLANWVNYDDIDKAFEFKYSPLWKADQIKQKLINFSVSESPETVITADWQSTSTSLNAYLLALDRANAKALAGKQSVQIERQGNVKIGTLNAYQRWQKLLATGSNQIATYIPVGNKIYVLSVSSAKLDDQTIQTYGLFLSTFKIISSSSAPKIK